MQCDAITKHGDRCKKLSRWHIPNTISGTGLGKNDWVQGREVNLCGQHAKQWHKIRRCKLINGGFLQPYNKYKYGSVVLCEIIDWDKPPTVAKAPEYWMAKISDDTISDGFGSTWSAWCPECHKKTMVVVRPGKV